QAHPCNQNCMMSIFCFPFFQSSDDDLLLFNPDRHQFFKIIPASYMHKCHKLRILCGWELPGAQ
ncbi:hypothetical protein, partial [Escherichia coli]|uniref:hypothetical protein n=1 Tax=Escherichia coli TaxID=562 RepID=UPI003C74930B